jgi:NAD-dependent deacetylase
MSIHFEFERELSNEELEERYAPLIEKKIKNFINNKTNNKKVLIFSGAGISAESGIRTFRDANGLWEEYNVEDVCSIEGFRRDPDLVNSFYDARRNDLRDKIPNTAHEMVARLKRKYPDQIHVLTQNVDDLFERAGCSDVIHLHGTLTQLRCEDCGQVFTIGYDSQEGRICPLCDSDLIRHNVVMFGESAPMYEKLQESISACDLLVVIGTSGQVINMGMYAGYFEKSILNNLDHDEYFDSFFTMVYHDKATVAAPMIEVDIENFLTSQ